MKESKHLERRRVEAEMIARIEFSRSQTLAEGADYCDFCYNWQKRPITDSRLHLKEASVK